MGTKPTTTQNTFNNGEISPRALGRFDLSKYVNSVKTLENWLIKQLGGVIFRPGRRYVADTKSDAVRSRLLEFNYSTTQNYIIEAGNLYFRFYTEDGQLQSGGSPVELVTIFATADLTKIRYTQNADTMYLFTGSNPVQKLTRTSATTFTISQVDFVRGPFLDANVTSTTITPSADTGTGITLTISTDTFESSHVGSFWRIKDGVVKITAVASGTSATADVQAEPDGTAGNLNTSASAVTDWAEGAFSAKRGYPKTGVFHDGRLWVANTDHQVGGIWASQTFSYENMDVGTALDNEAIVRELDGDTVMAIRWLSSGPKNLQAGTTGGPFTISSGAQGIAITPANITANHDSRFGCADIHSKRMFNFVYYAQNNKKRILESGYFFDVDQNDSVDTMLLADHILEPDIKDQKLFLRGDESTAGVFDMDTQQSPNNRLWVIRDDGQIAILTRNPRQEVNGWSRITAGKTVSCDGASGTGQFESIAVLQREGKPDQIWVIVNRIINGTNKRFVEYFTDEDFKYEWDAIRLDSSLTLDSPITITAITLSNPIVITAPSHGLSAGDIVRLDNIVGTHQLNGNEYEIRNVTANTFEIGTPS